jgi:hypothetical protein
MLSDTITTGMLAAAAYPRKRICAPQDYGWMRRVLRKIAEPIGRGGGRGRPMLWRLRNSGGE